MCLYQEEKMAGKLLAGLIVQKGVIVSQSNGLTFNLPTGLVTFPNADNLTAYPIVSYISPNATYATDTVFFKQIGNTAVTVWQGAQDTTGRNGSPTDFSLVVVGL
jgi:hypothetical protein